MSSDSFQGERGPEYMPGGPFPEKTRPQSASDIPPTYQVPISNAGYPPPPQNIPQQPFGSGSAYPPPQNIPQQPFESGARYPLPPQDVPQQPFGSGTGYLPPQSVFNANQAAASGASYPLPPAIPVGQGAPSGPGYAMPPQNPLPSGKVRQIGKLAQPLPTWSVALGVILVVALLLLLQFFTGSDWAEGASNASRVALVIGLILLAVLYIRNRAGMSSPANPTRRRQTLLSIVGIVLLFAHFVTFQALQPTLHRAQAHTFENQARWQDALHEYTLSGEAPPDGEDLARIYVSWGQALEKQQNYPEALTRFDTVIRQFNTSVGAQLKNAQTGDINVRMAEAEKLKGSGDYANALPILDTILNLSYCDPDCHKQTQGEEINTRGLQGQALMNKKDYIDASQSYGTLLGLSYCDTTCQHQYSGPAATAYYDKGEVSLKAKDYDTTIGSFDTVLKQFATSPEAKKLHGDMATALLGKGKAVQASSCSDAIPTYQRLANEYSNTPEGQTAKDALNAPQSVQGHFTNTESDRNFTQMALVTGISGIDPQFKLFAAWDNSPYKTDIQSDGTFTFQGVAQGDYDLMWSSYSGGEQDVEFIYDSLYFTPTYVAKVGPLCPVTVGDVSNQH